MPLLALPYPRPTMAGCLIACRRSGAEWCRELTENQQPVDIRLETPTMNHLDRITVRSDRMGGKPCIRGMRVTVGMVIGLIASGRTVAEVLDAYPYLEREDIMQALSYAAWRSEEREVELHAG